jgi:hypothetical protein
LSCFLCRVFSLALGVGLTERLAFALFSLQGFLPGFRCRTNRKTCLLAPGIGLTGILFLLTPGIGLTRILFLLVRGIGLTGKLFFVAPGIGLIERLFLLTPGIGLTRRLDFC